MKKLILIGLIVSVICISGCVQEKESSLQPESSIPLMEYENQFNFRDLIINNQMKQLLTYEELEDKGYVSNYEEVIEKEELDNKINSCMKGVSKNSDAILKFMEDHIKIIKEGYNKDDIKDFYCTDCFAYMTAYRNISNSNILLIFNYHNRFHSDASFDETIYCEIDSLNNVLKFYISSMVSHAS
ncbi:MAG: hypothetical protein JSW73_04000 [Candidatus Woesearchaeota archaeon]|nr:MAG: hypothetical protein JSW73_04000 [Candidatus Woesearchaeota archaeon]